MIFGCKVVAYWRKFSGLLEEMWRIIGGDGVVYLRRWGGVLEEIW